MAGVNFKENILKGKYFWLLIAPFMFYAKTADLINETRLVDPSLLNQGFYLGMAVLFIGLFCDPLISLIKYLSNRNSELYTTEN